VIEEDLERLREGIYDKVTGVGANEVISETPIHGCRQSEMEADEGESAGAALGYSYSLLPALPIVPGDIGDELRGAEKQYAYKERCIYCDIVRRETWRPSSRKPFPGCKRHRTGRHTTIPCIMRPSTMHMRESITGIRRLSPGSESRAALSGVRTRTCIPPHARMPLLS
jgi:hypothetical protein